MDDTVLPAVHALAAKSLSPTIIKEMEEMFLILGFSHTVVMKLVEEQGMFPMDPSQPI